MPRRKTRGQGGRPKLQDRVVIDYFTITIPYPCDKSKPIHYLSNNNNPQVAYRLKIGACQNMLWRVANALSLDGHNYTYASLSTLKSIETHGKNGYDKVFVLGHAQIAYVGLANVLPSSKIGMGIRVVLGSHALRDIENVKDFTSWRDWCRNFKQLFPTARIKRVDLAADFFHNHNMEHLTPLGLCDMSRHKAGRRIYSRARNGRLQLDTNFASGNCTGSTFYVGSRNSAYFLRDYDKLQERIHKHGDTWLKDKRIKHWYRWELQINAELAPKVFDRIAKGYQPNKLWLDLVRRLMYVSASKRDITIGNAKKISCKVWDISNKRYATKQVVVPKFWARFVKDSNVPAFDYSGQSPSWDKESLRADKHFAWLGRAVMPSLLKDLIAQIYKGGDANAFLNQLFKQSIVKLTPNDMDDIVKWSKCIEVSKFKKANNEFDFTQMLKGIKNQFTGMIGQRLYDLRNQYKFTKDDNTRRDIESYEDCIREYGLVDDITKFQKAGLIGKAGDIPEKDSVAIDNSVYSVNNNEFAKQIDNAVTKGQLQSITKRLLKNKATRSIGEELGNALKIDINTINAWERDK